MKIVIDHIGHFAASRLQSCSKRQQSLFVGEVERQMVELGSAGSGSPAGLANDATLIPLYSKNATVFCSPNSKK